MTNSNTFFQSSANRTCQLPREPYTLTIFLRKSNCQSSMYTVLQSNKSR